MNSCRIKGITGRLVILVLCLSGLARVGMAQMDGGTSRGMMLWDTVAPLGEKFTTEDRSGWKVVPGDLLLTEKEPVKASSDPGYYGREHSFQSDAVVETPTVTAVFQSAKGCVTIYSRQSPAGNNGSSEPAAGTRIVEVSPVFPQAGTVLIGGKEILRNAAGEIVLRVSFSHQGSRQITCVFSFDTSGIVEVKPGENMKNVRLSSAMAYGIVPGFIGDDLIFGGSERPSTNMLAVPSENFFLGLLEGGSTELVVTWPKGKQRMSLCFGEEHPGSFITSVLFDTDGQSFYLAALSAPRIWHKETLTPDYLERDVRVQWKPPFPAKWKTQLLEEELKTTFTFRPFKGPVWRGVAGSYDYPVWFSGDEVFYHLGKKIQPKGESLIYCLEGRDTPSTVLTPADILKQTLGRQVAGDILDFEGRKLRTHHRRGGEGVRRACTCGCTEAIQAVFEAGEEVSAKDYIQAALDDMIYFVRCHVERIDEYRRFANGVQTKIREKKRSSPNLSIFLDSMEEIAGQIPQECEVQKENMKTSGFADELAKKTIALASKKDPGNLKAFMGLLKAWRDMGGAQDYVVAKCHTITRNLHQTAGYGCGGFPQAVTFAEEIRAACRQTLRNADGYEIWADY